jgi:hypothetical protein
MEKPTGYSAGGCTLAPQAAGHAAAALNPGMVQYRA